MLLRADEDNDDVIESFVLYYIFSVLPSIVYYYTTMINCLSNILFANSNKTLQFQISDQQFRRSTSSSNSQITFVFVIIWKLKTF